jgi:hypothetical protein
MIQNNPKQREETLLIIATYRKLGTIAKTAKALGVSTGKVHYRLMCAGEDRRRVGRPGTIERLQERERGRYK